MLEKVIMNMHFSFHVQLAWCVRERHALSFNVHTYRAITIGSLSRAGGDKSERERESSVPSSEYTLCIYHNPFYIASQICFKRSLLSCVLILVSYYTMLLCISKHMYTNIYTYTSHIYFYELTHFTIQAYNILFIYNIYVRMHRQKIGIYNFVRAKSEREKSDGCEPLIVSLCVYNMRL